jgi:hypothetical protein
MKKLVKDVVPGDLIHFFPENTTIAYFVMSVQKREVSVIGVLFAQSVFDINCFVVNVTKERICEDCHGPTSFCWIGNETVFVLS